MFISSQKSIVIQFKIERKIYIQISEEDRFFFQKMKKRDLFSMKKFNLHLPPINPNCKQKITREPQSFSTPQPFHLSSSFLSFSDDDPSNENNYDQISRTQSLFSETFINNSSIVSSSSLSSNSPIPFPPLPKKLFSSTLSFPLQIQSPRIPSDEIIYPDDLKEDENDKKSNINDTIKILGNDTIVFSEISPPVRSPSANNTPFTPFSYQSNNSNNHNNHNINHMNSNNLNNNSNNNHTLHSKFSPMRTAPISSYLSPNKSALTFVQNRKSRSLSLPAAIPPSNLSKQTLSELETQLEENKKHLIDISNFYKQKLNEIHQSNAIIVKRKIQELQNSLNTFDMNNQDSPTYKEERNKTLEDQKKILIQMNREFHYKVEVIQNECNSKLRPFQLIIYQISTEINTRKGKSFLSDPLSTIPNILPSNSPIERYDYSFSSTIKVKPNKVTVVHPSKENIKS